MRINKISTLLFLFLVLSGCNPLSKQIIGDYIDVKHGDSLQIRTDSSYLYLEKLNTGITGETQGKWKIKKRRIYFKCDHKPLVGCRLKVNRDRASKDFGIKLLLADTQEPIHIEAVNFFKDGTIVKKDNFEQSNNFVKILSENFDSIVLQTFNFADIKFSDTLNKNYGYVVRIYPAERLYELDKVPFKVKGKTLKSTQTNEYNHIFLTLKKINIKTKME